MFHAANRHLVDNSGGTAYTMDYAEKRGLVIVNLAVK